MKVKRKKERPRRSPNVTGSDPSAAEKGDGGLATHTLALLPPGKAKLTTEETKNLLESAHLLKRLGIDPAGLLHDQFIAETAVRSLEVKDRASVPDLLIRMVNSPLQRNSPDALDAPSIRAHLRRARSWRKYVGERRSQASGTSHARDLDACAEAVGLARPRGGQPKPLNELLVDQLDYWAYMRFQTEFASRTGTPTPKPGERMDEIRISELEVAWALAEAAGALSPRDFDAALARQVEAFKAAKGTSIALSPSDYCALALWEFKRGTLDAENDLDDAKKYVWRLQRDLRLLRARSSPNKPPKT
jgi:hypothetical protein